MFRKCVVIFLSCFLYPPACFAELVFADGGTHIVDYLETDFIRVSDDSSGTPTSVTFQAGASGLKISGGQFLDDVFAAQDAFVTISGVVSCQNRVFRRISCVVNFEVHSCAQQAGSLCYELR